MLPALLRARKSDHFVVLIVPIFLYHTVVTANLNVKLADLGEARFFSDTDPRKLPRYRYLLECLNSYFNS